MLHTLEEIAVAEAEDRLPPREAFALAKQGGEMAPLTANQHRLLAALKAKRLEVARAQKQPAFIIFHDKVLIEMARRRPKTNEDLRAIPGIGADKMARHGAIFLAVIANCDGDS
jgi:ATP-dependent DNA helicase RecQ